MKVAVIQSNYVPWKGYFDIIRDVDLFVFYDDTQYTVRDWRNRNQIKTADGLLWLTVPVEAGSRDKLVQEVAIAGTDWAAKHWKSLAHHYGPAPYFKQLKPFFEDIYLGRSWTKLSELNQHLTTRIARELLGIQTPFVQARDYHAQGRKQDRLLDVLGKVGATSYLSGPTARAYIDPVGFEAAGIALEYKDYSGYPVYAQFHGPFTHGVSIVDLLFQTGPHAAEHIWGEGLLEKRIQHVAFGLSAKEPA